VNPRKLCIPTLGVGPMYLPRLFPERGYGPVHRGYNSRSSPTLSGYGVLLFGTAIVHLVAFPWDPAQWYVLVFNSIINCLRQSPQ
jgi:hypothetical protein